MNIIHTILFTLVSWSFFKRRIPYEEESLIQHFPESYPTYRAKTYVGIPFIPQPNLTPPPNPIMSTDDDCVNGNNNNNGTNGSNQNNHHFVTTTVTTTITKTTTARNNKID